MTYIIAVKFFSNTGNSKEIAKEVIIRKDGPSTQPLLLSEEIEKENQRFQGHSACAPCSVCPDVAQSRSAGVAGSTNDLTEDSTSKNTQSHTEQNMEEKNSQFPFTDSKPYTSNGSDLFSCCRTAIAVEYFWKLGHRNTPSRTIFGEGISSHVDRFILHLAEKTGGVVVSNDNFREFVNESVSWREIIAKRWLKYTFVGDIFMVPNDPLGRKGPQLVEFLGKESSVRDRQPLLRALPNVDWFSRSRNNQVANTRHQPPNGNLGASSGPWLPQQPHFTSLASIPGGEKKHLMSAQRYSGETSELREALLKTFPDSEQRQKIEEIMVAQPILNERECSFRSNVGPKSGHQTESLVTGIQRFREMLKIPYKLGLKNEPGRTDLKHIVIDGCNVAFTHGLNKFYSCRGIAIAVEYFWELGHRNITVFVPQWRTRHNPNVTEQHFLTQLQELGILALTPSRTMFGEHIASQVDRFLLCLAEKTGGVIVSNDNFREFVNESVSWREIIAKRWLQYAFVGDIFMVPNYPLGRKGPQLEEFLGKESSVRDRQPLLRALPNVDWFSRSRNNQVANTRHQPPNGNLGASSGPWLPQQPHFTSLASIPGGEKKHLMSAQRYSGETSELREALLKTFPDSEQRQKIEEIMVAQPILNERECSFRSNVGPKSGHQTESLVTGIQRFREMLKIPYKLELKDEPGRTDLKHIVIDGCNVAFTHGLKKFFSCRGIAIAVEYFWELGHRKITVFVPQWRTRLNPNVTEQHFLTQLQELGILVLTPSRTMFGEHIASHDDRFQLHLADKTGGVIVSNDNFREFVNESMSWREIIAKRLLKYTFVGDIFMVPNDPLGRKGPRLDEFLGKESSVRDRQPLLRALPNVDWFSRSRNNQVANTRHQPPNGNLGASSGPWLPQQPHFTSMASILGILENGLMPAQRYSGETSELREALLKTFPDSEQRQKIEEIMVAQPILNECEHSNRCDVGPKSGHQTESLVTGIQRFSEMLKIPYKLGLKNEPGRTDLKHIVIDGCNVAFTHGLNKFYSCRGIAIAVEYFWELGHRNITVFVPQWRTRRNPNVTEQHFLTQLQELGLLFLTPSRRAFGELIASNDNRFLLNLAEKTGGVIVSNDNFREFVNESMSWREIIAKRWLQYAFVEDIFMVPDDPLGRKGPRLEEFLGKESSVRDRQPLLRALPNVDWFSWSRNNQVANTRHQPPNGNLGASSGPWLPQQPHFTSLASIPGGEKKHLMSAQRYSAETSELREAPLKIFHDSKQKQKIDKIMVAQPILKEPKRPFWPGVGPKSWLRAQG
ncbi:NEDD4-binding protein 1 [Microtus ochrogaster]|uniref:NEDD4-binding protein 1 n=1 Tax=Microtus ochrogaster TaxID=79684 RepID=A0A8J6GM33_MICOH|nr:NEDD4-binding protein 1 [Microtus ochrogaster]